MTLRRIPEVDRFLALLERIKRYDISTENLLLEHYFLHIEPPKIAQIGEPPRQLQTEIEVRLVSASLVYEKICNTFTFLSNVQISDFIYIRSHDNISKISLLNPLVT